MAQKKVGKDWDNNGNSPINYLRINWNARHKQEKKKTKKYKSVLLDKHKIESFIDLEDQTSKKQN